MISENGEDARLRLVGPRGVAVVTAMLVAVDVSGLDALRRAVDDEAQAGRRQFRKRSDICKLYNQIYY